MEGLRNKSMSAGQGKDAKESSQLTGEAKPTKAWKSTNDTKQYVTGSSKKGSLGGENTNS